MFNTKDLSGINARVSSAVATMMEQWTGTYKEKNSNYGASWLLSGETMSLWFPKGLKLTTTRQFIMFGLMIRMLDKLIRSAHLELTSEQDKVGEISSETFGDLGVYAFMAAAAALDEKSVNCVVNLPVNR